MPGVQCDRGKDLENREGVQEGFNVDASSPGQTGRRC